MTTEADYWARLRLAAEDMRALSPGEMQQRELEMMPLMRQAKPSLEQLLMANNYRPLVFVPDGWRDWFAVGDQLH